MNSEQLTGMLKPMIAGIVAYLAGAHILFDANTWNIIITTVVTAGLAAWSAHEHTTTNQINSVGKPGTTVVTSPTIAKALPENPNVVSTSDVKVVNK